FFQAEDGIRDFHVTGVQTCALPIWHRPQAGTPPGSADQSCPWASPRTGNPAPGPALAPTRVKAAPASAADPQRRAHPSHRHRPEIGRASCRERLYVAVVAVEVSHEK